MDDETLSSERKIVTRSEARASGLKRYFPGSMCPRGHIAERTTSNGECVVCSRSRCVNNVRKWREAAKAADIEGYRAKRAAEARRRYEKSAQHINAVQKAWLARNAEKRRSTMRSWRVANADKVAAYDAKWKAENPDRFKEKVKRRSARRRGRKVAAEGSFTAADISALFDDQGGLCAGCFEPLTPRYEIDHVIPLARGGSNWPSNLQLLCRSCNARKWAFTMSEWNERRTASPPGAFPRSRNANHQCREELQAQPPHDHA
ncbi:HNH endonuclease [Azorhizobium caulinodans]|uniref:HNH endonuclease n=1 Tax=Azorhizobium caulinodans TaxID=7 RepID=UPI002FBE869E